MKDRKKPEILAPANDLDVLKTAIRYGADAVYIGGEQFSLRAKAENFSEESMREGIEYAHSLGKKVYITANITAHDRDLQGVRTYFEKLRLLHPDALIISDPGVFLIAREVCPEIDVHISTQANSVNSLTCRFWYEQGAKRVVTARELSLAEIKEINESLSKMAVDGLDDDSAVSVGGNEFESSDDSSKKSKPLEIECIVHGAMCISHSGRCLLSHYFTGRDANLGACTHPCRWRYHIVEETRPGEYLPIEENERGTYIFNSKDLCMVDHIPELIEAGIDSFKIEGRMKTALYVASVTRAYRQAVDDYFEDEERYRSRIPYYLDEVTKCTYREHTTGFYFGTPTHEAQIYDSNTYKKGAVYLGTVSAVTEENASPDMQETESVAWLTQKNKFAVGDTIEIMHFDGTNDSARVLEMFDENGKHIDSCPHPKQKIGIELDKNVNEGEIIRS